MSPSSGGVGYTGGPSFSPYVQCTRSYESLSSSLDVRPARKGAVLKDSWTSLGRDPDCAPRKRSLSGVHSCRVRCDLCPPVGLADPSVDSTLEFRPLLYPSFPLPTERPCFLSVDVSVSPHSLFPGARRFPSAMCLEAVLYLLSHRFGVKDVTPGPTRHRPRGLWCPRRLSRRRTRLQIGSLPSLCSQPPSTPLGEVRHYNRIRPPLSRASTPS